MFENESEIQNIETQTEASLMSSVEQYREMKVKPIHWAERNYYKTELRPKGEKFTRIDHWMSKHGQGLREVFQSSDETQVLAGLVNVVQTADDSYRDQETHNKVYFKEGSRVIVVVKDEISEGKQAPPPPAFIVTAYTIDNPNQYYNRKVNREIH